MSSVRKSIYNTFATYRMCIAGSYNKKNYRFNYKLKTSKRNRAVDNERKVFPSTVVFFKRKLID